MSVVPPAQHGRVRTHSADPTAVSTAVDSRSEVVALDAEFVLATARCRGASSVTSIRNALHPSGMQNMQNATRVGAPGIRSDAGRLRRVRRM